jgi:hypothetical protein
VAAFLCEGWFMNDLLCIMHTSRRSGWASRLLIVMACLLIGVRLVGGFICNTCYLDFEQPKSRSFHRHSSLAGRDIAFCCAGPLTDFLSNALSYRGPRPRTSCRSVLILSLQRQ